MGPGHQPYLKIFKHPSDFVKGKDLPQVTSVSQVGSKVTIFGKTILYAHVFSTSIYTVIGVKNGVIDNICGREASSICT